MNHTTKPASGLLVIAILATVVLSACLPLPATTVPSQTQEVAAPRAVETAAPQVAETAAPQVAETAAPQVAETAVPEGSATVAPQATEPVTQAAAVAAIEGTLWTLVSYADEEGETVKVLPGTEVTAQFNDGTVGGTAGCNNYFAAYELDGNQLTVGVGGTTMMACEEAVMVQESAYMSNLAASAAFLITGTQLQIAGADGRTLLTYEVSQPIALSDTLWLLTMYNNGEEALVSTLAGTEITAIFGEDGSLYGSAGCNSYNAEYTVDVGAMTISAPATTRMMCGMPDGVMDQEAAYLAALPLAASYSILGNELDIADADGNTLLVFTAGTSAPLTGVTWSLISFNNERAITSVILDTEITAVFGEDGMLTGSAGCNTYNAPYSIDGDNIFIGMAATTRMMCAEPAGIMEQEAEYLAAIQKAATYKADSERLDLLDADGRIMAIYAVQPETPLESTQEAGIAPAIIGAPWQWVVTLYSDDTKVIPENSEDYVLELLPEGQLTVKADCNTAVGTYTLKDMQLSMQVTASTMQACGPGSLADQFIKDLNASQSYLMDGEDLIVTLKFDTGSMRLETTEPVPGASPSAKPATPEVKPTVEPATPEVPPVAETGGGLSNILGVIWKWESFTPDTGEPVTVDNPESYEFMLLPTGIIRLKADCNSGSGTHWIDADGSISIEVLALTRAACPPDSLSSDFVGLLNKVSAYWVDEGNLFLAVGGDGGTMMFSPAE
jgi:heat shock protein HslJ